MLWHPDITLDPGPNKVLLKKDEFIDAARNDRAVPYKIYYPDLPAGERAPVIIWSHGFGGNRDGAAFLSRYLASYGYVVAHLTHIGTDSSLWEGKDGHPWDILRKTKVSRETTLDRFRPRPGPGETSRQRWGCCSSATPPSLKTTASTAWALLSEVMT